MSGGWEWPGDEGGDVQSAGSEAADLINDANTIVSAADDAVDAVDAESNEGGIFRLLSFFGFYEEPDQT